MQHEEETLPSSAMHSAACLHIHDAAVDSKPMLALTSGRPYKTIQAQCANFVLYS